MNKMDDGDKQLGRITLKELKDELGFRFRLVLLLISG